VQELVSALQKTDLGIFIKKTKTKNLFYWDKKSVKTEYFLFNKIFVKNFQNRI